MSPLVRINAPCGPHSHAYTSDGPGNQAKTLLTFRVVGGLYGMRKTQPAGKKNVSSPRGPVWLR